MTRNLWHQDRKRIHRELVATYQREGYTKKEAKKLASEEIDDMMETQTQYVKELLDLEED